MSIVALPFSSVRTSVGSTVKVCAVRATPFDNPVLELKFDINL